MGKDLDDERRLDGYYLSEWQKEVVGVIEDHKNEICSVLLNSGKFGKDFFEKMVYSILCNFRTFNLWKLSGYSVDVKWVTNDEVLSEYDWLNLLFSVIIDEEYKQRLIDVYKLKVYRGVDRSVSSKLEKLDDNIEIVFEKHSRGTGICSVEDSVLCNIKDFLESLSGDSNEKVELFEDEIVYHYSDKLDVKLLFKFPSMWYLDDISYDFKDKNLDFNGKCGIISDFYNFINR